jgi:hypothetical protein
MLEILANICKMNEIKPIYEQKEESYILKDDTTKYSNTLSKSNKDRK